MPTITLRRDDAGPVAESVGIKGVTFQSVRRTFATHFHRVGTVKDQQARNASHQRLQTTMNIYTQAMSDSHCEQRWKISTRRWL